MSDARIDRCTVMRMIAAELLEALAGETLVMPGENDPPEATRWIRVVSVGLTNRERRKGTGDAQIGDIRLSLLAVVTPTEVDPRGGGTIYRAAHMTATIARAIEEKVITQEEGGGDHVIDLGPAAHEDVAIGDEERGLFASSLIVTGTVTRASGDSVMVLG